MIILDTDHLTLLQWGGNEGAKISKRLADLGIRRPPTSIVSYEEQTRGWLGELAKSAQMTWQIEVYARLHNTLGFYSTLQVFDFDAVAATHFQRLRAAKVRIGTMDLKIAAIALAHEATVFTRNVRDFGLVPGLRIEDATR